MRGLRQVAISRKYMLVSGALLTSIAAALVLACLPMGYRSTGTLVVMPPKRPSVYSANPLLGLDNRMDTTASMLVQTINGPQVPFRAGVVHGRESVSAKNAASGSVAPDQDGNPFITLTAESPDARRGPAIVSWVADVGRENLADVQRDLRVAKRNTVTLEEVVAPTPSKPILIPPIGATVATILLGLVITASLAYGLENRDIRRRGDGRATVLPFTRGAGRPAVVPAVPVARVDTDEDLKVC